MPFVYIINSTIDSSIKETSCEEKHRYQNSPSVSSQYIACFLEVLGYIPPLKYVDGHHHYKYWYIDSDCCKWMPIVYIKPAC